MNEFLRKFKKVNIEIDIDFGIEHILGAVLLIVVLLWMLT